MQVTIKQTTDQPVLSRKEVIATVSFEGEPTPSNNQIKAEIAKATKAKENLIVMKGLSTKFGSGSGDMKVYVYASPESKDQFEELTKHQKDKMKKEAEEKAKAAEEAKKAAEEAKKKAEEEKAAAEAAKAEPAAEEKSE